GAAAVGLAFLPAGCGSSSHRSSSPHGHALVSIFEAGLQLRSAPVQTMATLRRLGVDVVKVFLHWDEVGPDPLSRAAPVGFHASDPAAYPAAKWTIWDDMVRAAAARGMAVDLTVSNPPEWAGG